MLKSIVLLSGGMDSAVALYWAAKNTDVKAVLHFDYGQRARAYEFKSALDLVRDLDIPTTMIQVITVPRFPGKSKNAGRNLVFLALATPYAFIHEANLVIGGWCAEDGPDFPDCSPGFLQAASKAMVLSLGRPGEWTQSIEVFSPVLSLNKEATIHTGDHLGVPWDLTRTCYSNKPVACGECPSCVKRIKAFVEYGNRDPLYSETEWAKLLWSNSERKNHENVS